MKLGEAVPMHPSCYHKTTPFTEICFLIQKNEERHQGFKRHSEQMMKNIGQNEVIQKKWIDCERPLQVVD